MRLHTTPLISSNIISMLAHSAVEELIPKSLPVSLIHDFSVTQINSGKIVVLSWETQPTTPKTVNLVMGVGYQRHSPKSGLRNIISSQLNIASFHVVDNQLKVIQSMEKNDIIESLYELMKGHVSQESFTEDVSANMVLNYNSEVTANTMLKAVNILTNFQ